MQTDFQVGIVGAGFGGIITALELRRAGIDSFVIFERASEVGGVWRENVYPGCACDVPSHLYSIEDQPNPRWTSSYASQPEILEYLKNTARASGLLKYIRFNTRIQEARFVEEEGCWHILDQHGCVCRVRAMVLATGPQNRRFTPAFPGLKSFTGTMCHSAEWDYSIDLKGKRVAVIGTGASSIQIVPNIAPEVAALFVFQRTPAWIMPRGERKISAFEHFLFSNLPFTQKLARWWTYWFMEFVGLAFLGNAFITRRLTRIALNKIEKEVKDPDVRRRLTPGYEIGCKRLLLSDDFYPAFNRPNVSLITDPVSSILPDGVRTVDGKVYEVDHIVLATGFTVADADQYLRIVGRQGRVLEEEWARDGIEAYLGMTVSGFPNMAILLGPNSGLGHSSAVHVMESQLGYVLQYLAALDKAENAFLDVEPEVQRVYNIDIQQRLKRTVWNSGCKSWYLNRMGKNVTLYPGLTATYRRVTARFNARDFQSIEPAMAKSAPALYLPSLRH